MFKLLIFSVFTTLFVPIAHAQGSMCLDIFYKKEYVPLSDYSEIEFRLDENEPTFRGFGTKRKNGRVSVNGRERESGDWVSIGTLEYTVLGNLLTVNRLIERPEYYGQGIYTRMIESVLEKNLNVNVLAINLSGSFFKKYREDYARLGDEKAAVQENPVYQQLKTLGFKNIDTLFELSNTQQVFVRLILSRPFE